jgi:hypothetical protein
VSDAYGGGAPWGAPLEWAAMGSIASKGMTAETLRIWARRAEVDGGEALGVKRGEGAHSRARTGESGAPPGE